MRGRVDPTNFPHCQTWWLQWPSLSYFVSARKSLLFHLASIPSTRLNPTTKLLPRPWLDLARTCPTRPLAILTVRIVGSASDRPASTAGMGSRLGANSVKHEVYTDVMGITGGRKFDVAARSQSARSAVVFRRLVFMLRMVGAHGGRP